jgi:tetratricopeptide (TPR) repeat protein
MSDRHLRQIAAMRKRGQTEEALRMFKELVRDPDASAAVHLEYGYMLDNLSREARAIRHYTKALALGLPPSDRVSCLVCLASSFRNRKRFDEALSTIERAAAEFPSNQVVVCFHALILSDHDRAAEGLARLGTMAVPCLDGPEMEPFRSVLLSRYRGLSQRARRDRQVARQIGR